MTNRWMIGILVFLQLLALGAPARAATEPSPRELIKQATSHTLTSGPRPGVEGENLLFPDNL